MKALAQDPLNIIITGVGGQGNVLISQILGQVFLNQGFRVTVGETFGLSQRGGSVQSHIRVSEKTFYGPLIPEGGAHIILGLEPLETLRVLPRFGQPDLVILVNNRPAPPLNVIAGEARYPSEEELKTSLAELSQQVYWLAATEAAQELGAAVMANVVMLGALTAAGVIPVTSSDMESALEAFFGQGKIKNNLTAFRKGLSMVS